MTPTPTVSKKNGDGSPSMVELRVHGVGGSSPEAILGVVSPTDTVLVAGGHLTGFYARRTDRTVEGYVWGPLTSGSRLQPLWLLLLPFTLVNVAGWMHPQTDQQRARTSAMTLRGLVSALAVTLTGSWILWVTIIAVTGEAALAKGTLRIFNQRLTWLPSASPGRWAALAFVAGIVGALLLMARATQHGFEKVAVPGVASTSKRPGPLGLGDETLQSDRFFGHPVDASRLLVVHAVVGAATLAVAVWLVVSAGPDLSLAARRLGQALVAVGAAQIPLIGLIALWSIKRTEGASRLLPAAATAAMAVALNNGFFAGTEYALVRATGGHPGAHPELALIDVFVITLAILLAGLLIWAAVSGIVWPRSSLTQDLKVATSGPAEPLNGLTGLAQMRAVGRARALAAGVRHLEAVIAVTAATFSVGSIYFGIRRSALLGSAHGGVLDLVSPEKGRVVTVAARLVPWFAVTSIGFARAAMTRDSSRRTIGIAWDVLTFWPRRFHPLAVRPYTERAVPEFQARLTSLRREGRVLVAAHSQGAVIAFAALAPEPPADLGEVDLLTFGSPLNGIYRQMFPAYFNQEIFESVGEHLLSWQNYTRLTDPVGHRVGRPATDQVLDDPGVTSAGDQIRVSEDAPLEHDRYPWIKIARHSYYFSEPALKAWVAARRPRRVDMPPPPR